MADMAIWHKNFTILSIRTQITNLLATICDYLCRIKINLSQMIIK
jgi:hypothetical protein